MRSVYEHYKETTEKKEDWLYYIDMLNDLANEFSIDTAFLNGNARDFIESYFAAGGKRQAFEWLINNTEFKLSDDRANHTFSAFLLGVFLRKSLHLDMKRLPKLHDRITDNFLYFWTLTCLYHDAAFHLEKNKDVIQNCKKIDGFIKHFGIEHNLIDVIEDNESCKLIENYYNYRANSNEVDHGIAGAMLLYDGLLKAYTRALNESTKLKSGGFLHNGLNFSRDYKKHCRFIAETIARHNMWRAHPSKEAEYKRFGLESLVKRINNDHLLTYGDEHNLLFLLGLVDTIEPLKCFQKHAERNSNSAISPYDIIRNISITTNYKTFKFSLYSSIAGTNEFISTIDGLRDWMDVSIIEDVGKGASVQIRKPK